MPESAELELLEDGGRATLVPVVAPEVAEPLLELVGITKRWPRLERPVLDDVDLELQPGSVTWIGGCNGIGKTTLMRIAAGLIGCDDGSVRLDGLHPVRDRRAYQARCGFVSAGTGGLYARLTVRWHLDWWARIAFVAPRQRKHVVRAALERFELVDLARRRVDRMSMGQRQRVRIAGAFLHDPDVVLLDEPRNSLDAEGVEVLAGAVRAATARGAAVLWCAPSGEEEKIESDRRLLLEHGRLVAA
jgi:ABC-type multidrug transport system ATPase subunit